MRPQTLLIIAAYSLSVIGLSDEIGVFSLTPASLLLGLPFTVTGVSSGTLAALGALKLLAATALALSYTGQSLAHNTFVPPSPPPHGGGGGEGHGAPSYGGQDGGYGAPGGYHAAEGPIGHAPIYRRAVVDNSLGNLELYFHIINEVDANNCALRLICELEAQSKESKDALDDDERMILALFGSKPKQVSIEALKTPSGPYHFAAFVGSSSSVSQCSQFYSKCPYSSTQMMSALRSASTNQQ